MGLMKVLQKWNGELHDYEPLLVPEKWNVKTYSEDMTEKVNCPHCGTVLLYGETYTSLEVHNAFGIGYGVCKDCYKKETERKFKNDL